MRLELPLDSYLGPHLVLMVTHIRGRVLPRALSMTRKSLFLHPLVFWVSLRLWAMSLRMRKGGRVCF